MNRSLVIFIAVIVLAVVGSEIRFGISQKINPSVAKTDVSLARSVDNVRRQLPIDLGNDTILTDVKIENDAVIYQATLGGFDFSVINIEQFARAQKITNLFAACLDDNAKIFFENGVDLKFDYRSPEGQSLFVNKVSESDCAALIDEDISKLLEGFINRQSEALPMQVDTETEWISIERTENGIQYVYRLINYSSSELDLDFFKKAIKKEILAATCYTPEMKLFLKRGLTITFTYFDKLEKEVHSFNIKSGEC